MSLVEEHQFKHLNQHFVVSSFTAEEEAEGLTRLVINLQPAEKSTAKLHIQRALIDNKFLGVVERGFVLLCCRLKVPNFSNEGHLKQFVQARVELTGKKENLLRARLRWSSKKTLIKSGAQSTQDQLQFIPRNR